MYSMYRDQCRKAFQKLEQLQQTNAKFREYCDVRRPVAPLHQGEREIEI